jgi:hypothetical protein
MRAERIPQPRIVIVPADNAVRLDAIRKLFIEYAESFNYGVCFQTFEKELAELPGEYAPWSGMLLLGWWTISRPGASPCAASKAGWQERTENCLGGRTFAR